MNLHTQLLEIFNVQYSIFFINSRTFPVYERVTKIQTNHFQLRQVLKMYIVRFALTVRKASAGSEALHHGATVLRARVISTQPAGTATCLPSQG